MTQTKEGVLGVTFAPSVQVKNGKLYYKQKGKQLCQTGVIRPTKQ